MFSAKTEAPSANRTKVEFPLGLAVDNVTLRNLERNKNILGIDFNFQRIEGETISWLTGSILPPQKEWFTQPKKIGENVVTPEQQFNSAVNSFLGYVKHITAAAGVSMNAYDEVRSETLEGLIDGIITVANENIDSKATFYLKTIKDKKGYTKIPQYKGSGVAQSSSLGYPSKHVYTQYEQDLIDACDAEGVVDNTTTSSTKSGLDF